MIKYATGLAHIASLLLKMDKRLTLLVLVLALFSCKTSNDCIGKAKPDTMCPMIYDPVCGCDGKTYGSSCMAGAAGIKTWKPGECK